MVKKTLHHIATCQAETDYYSFDYRIEFAFIAHSTLTADRMLARSAEVL